MVRALSSDLGMEKSPAQSLVVLILVGLEGEVLSMIVNCDLNTLLSTYYCCQGVIREPRGPGGGGSKNIYITTWHESRFSKNHCIHHQHFF